MLRAGSWVWHNAAIRVKVNLNVWIFQPPWFSEMFSYFNLFRLCNNFEETKMKLCKIFGPIVVCVGGGKSWSRNSRYNKLAITKPVPVVVILSSYFLGASTIKNIVFQNQNFQSLLTKITRCLKSLFWDIDTFVLNSSMIQSNQWWDRERLREIQN